LQSPFNIPFQTQLDYLWKELTGSESATLDAFNSGQYITPQEYAQVFENKYERADGKGLGKRQAYALDVFNSMKDNLNPQNIPQGAAIAYNYLLNKGLSEAQAAGIVGNLMVESYPEVNPSAYNPSGGGQGAYGIAQWRGPRLASLLDFAGQSMPEQQPAQEDKQMNPMSRMAGAPAAAKNLWEKLTSPTPDGGISPLRRFGAALDPLILKGYGIGDQIRAEGQREAAIIRGNRTADMLRTQPGGEMYAKMIEQGMDPAKVIAQYQRDKAEGLIGGGINQRQLDNIMKFNDKLRNDMSYKEAQAVRQGYQNVLYAFQNPSGVSDYALTIAFAKILDPGSVVREGEQAAIANTGGQISSWLSQTSNFFSGQGSLPEDVRKQIMNYATNNYNQAMGAAKERYDEAAKLAEASNIDTQYLTKFDFTPLDQVESTAPDNAMGVPPIPNGAIVDGQPMTSDQWKIIWNNATYADKQEYFRTGQLPGAS